MAVITPLSHRLIQIIVVILTARNSASAVARQCFIVGFYSFVNFGCVFRC